MGSTQRCHERQIDVVNVVTRRRAEATSSRRASPGAIAALVVRYPCGGVNGDQNVVSGKTKAQNQGTKGSAFRDDATAFVPSLESSPFPALLYLHPVRVISLAYTKTVRLLRDKKILTL